MLPLVDFSASRNLEVGCGEGVMLLELWRRRKGNSLFVGIETDAESVNLGNLIAKASNASGVFIGRGSALQLSFGDEEFDQALLIDVLRASGRRPACPPGNSSRPQAGRQVGTLGAYT